MKGWPNRRRLLWGRRSLMKSLALSIAMLLVVTLAAGIYFFTPLFSGSQNHSHESSADLSSSVQDEIAQNHLASIHKSSNQTGTYRDILKIASVQPALSASLNTSSLSGRTVTYAELENTGQDMLSQIKINASDGKLIGVLSQLFPGEKKTLALSAVVEKANVTAIDSSGNLVKAKVHFSKPSLSLAAQGFGLFLGGGSSSENSNPEPAAVTSEPVPYENKIKNNANSSQNNTPRNNNSQNNNRQSSQTKGLQTNSSQTDSSQINSSKKIIAVTSLKATGNSSTNKTREPLLEPRFNLTIRTNQSVGHRGDVISFECSALNSGKEDLSNLELECGGKRTSTTYLTPGKGIKIDGSFKLHDNTVLNATVKGNDTEGNAWMANETAQVWLISPDLVLKANAQPETVHRGDEISLSVSVENAGKNSLSNITVSDSLGQIGQIQVLDPGKAAILHNNRTVGKSVLDLISATAHSLDGKEVHGSAEVEIKVLGSSLNLTSEPKEAVVYPGQPVNVNWVLNNTGEEVLKNITIAGTDSRYRLKEMAPGSSIRMSTVYVLNKSTTINVTARGYDPRGYAVQDRGSILVRAVSPGISLKVTPSSVEGFVGEIINITCLVTNTGNDALTNVVLSLKGSPVDRIDSLSPGEFHVFSQNLKITSNSTLDFGVVAVDSLGRTWSDSSHARASLVTSAVMISANAPDSVKSGESARITCRLNNPGSVPLYNVLVNSKTFGPLGLVEYLAPGQQKMLTVDEPVKRDVDDEIKAEGVTSTKQPVINRCRLHISSKARTSPASSNPKTTAKNETGPIRISPTPATTIQTSALYSSNLGAKAEEPESTVGKNSELNLKAKKVTYGEPPISYSTPAKKPEPEKSSAQVTENPAAMSTVKTNNIVVDEISGLVQYIKKMLLQMNHKTSSVSQSETPSTDESGNGQRAAKNYELAIESAKGSDHGRVKVMDVSASPTNPSAGTPVKITAHVQSESGIDSASVKFGVKDTPITKMQMSSVARIYTIPMALVSGDSKNGYWSCSLPGRAAGTYMVLSLAIKDDAGAVDDGPYMLHWSTVDRQGVALHATPSQATSDQGMLYTESSVVRGKGDVSVKDTFNDNVIGYNGWMKGNGSINMESLRSLDKNRPMVNFTQRSDLVFEGGHLTGEKCLESPVFYGGIGASVTERFNLSHVDKSETDMIRSLNSSDNTLAFNADQAFNGSWNIKTQYAQLFKKMKGDQQYSGSFETQKKIKFQDLGKN